MEEHKIIRITEICDRYQVQRDFILSLKEYGLIRLISQENEQFLQAEDLRDLETLMHLHFDLEINMEGIDAISHLLERVRDMQRELNDLRNRIG